MTSLGYDKTLQSVLQTTGFLTKETDYAVKQGELYPVIYGQFMGSVGSGTAIIADGSL
jgi:hypothetical protein